MKKHIKYILLPTLSLTAVLPLFASAQGFFGPCFGFRGIDLLLCRISYLLNSVLPILLALGVVYFVWGVVQYVIGDSEEVKEKGKNHIIYGIIGLVVIIGLWGLVYIVANTFGLGGEPAPTSYQLRTLLPY
ncbi:hypothetical protein A3C67_03250 [Candidatus Nomurabacteria bacterium RIFCSPHIGHO2_02_FULL_42_19]|uniref:Uncharacterized protein n=1 Tax=Candidatus Nomurabacteria bacterium RIFCSPHIGHO2_02_FULL_42_19 TaxID=1801756 RepID=A0A1F6W353_9BACT|nr:MAG: hypothetical protein A3C67_03250 [Candidatus Nomurabacteria bacterium RIFCSPHIGHO2_02_FULL_42_19]